MKPQSLQERLWANQSAGRRKRWQNMKSRRTVFPRKTRPMLDTMRMRRREAEMYAHYRKPCWWIEDPAVLYPGINFDNIFGKDPEPAGVPIQPHPEYLAQQSAEPPLEFGGQLRYLGMKQGNWKIDAPMMPPPPEAFSPETDRLVWGMRSSTPVDPGFVFMAGSDEWKPKPYADMPPNDACHRRPGWSISGAKYSGPETGGAWIYLDHPDSTPVDPYLQTK